MTRITLFRSRSHAIGFEAEGHTGYAEEGSDIVCGDRAERGHRP